MRAPLASLSLVALLAACAPQGIAPRETELPAASLGLGDEAAPAVPPRWWTVFGDAGLDRLMDEALAGNPELAVAIARLRAAKAGVEAADAQLFPQADFDAQEARLHISGRYIYPPPYAGTDRWIGTLGADLSWNIDFWGREQAQLDKAKDLRIAAALDAAAARLALTSALVEAYIELDRADKLADIAAETERDRADTLALTERRLHDGLDSEVERQEALALLSQAREERVRADSARDIVVHEIAELIGRGADAYPAIPKPRLALDAALALPHALPADLLSRRPDVLAAKARVDAAVEGRAAARAAFYPDIDLLATAGWAAIGISPLLHASSEQYGGGPAVHLPIFDAGALRAQYAGATAALDVAVADYNASLTGAVRQVSDALTRIRALDGERGQHRDMLAAAEKGYRLAEVRYRAGLADQLTVLNAESVVFGAREGEVSLAADSAVQRVALIVASGGGFDVSIAAQRR